MEGRRAIDDDWGGIFLSLGHIFFCCLCGGGGNSWQLGKSCAFARFSRFIHVRLFLHLVRLYKFMIFLGTNLKQRVNYKIAHLVERACSVGFRTEPL